MSVQCYGHKALCMEGFNVQYCNIILSFIRPEISYQSLIYKVLEGSPHSIANPEGGRGNCIIYFLDYILHPRLQISSGNRSGVMSA